MSNDLPPTTDQQNDALHRADVARIIAWNPTLQSGRTAHLGISAPTSRRAACW